MKDANSVGYAIQQIYAGKIRYVWDVIDNPTYLTSMLPHIFTHDEALKLVSKFKEYFPDTVSIVEVEYVIKAKSWVRFDYRQIEEYVNKSYDADIKMYMKALADLMKEGKVRLTDGKWEVYQ